MKFVSFTVVLILTLSSLVLAQASEIRVSGEYTAGAGDLPETARQLATLNASLKALERAAGDLSDAPSIKGLRLSEPQLAAYTAGLLELPEAMTRSEGNVFKSELAVRVDSAEAARRFETLRQDTEANRDLLQASQRSRQLREKLAQDSLVVRNATPGELAKAVEARQVTLGRLQANLLLARARFAVARHELGPSSNRVPSEEGRRRAKQLVDRALAIDQSNPDAHRVLGDLLLLEDQPSQAEKEFREVLKANPNSGIDHNKLGNAILEQDRAPEAIAEFTEALRINPADMISHADLGLVLRSQLDMDHAIAEFREAIRIDPSYVEAHNYLGIAFATMGQIPEALAEFQEVIRIQPDASLGHFNAASALADLDRDQEATNELRQAVRLNPNHYNAHYNLGEMLRLNGDLEESAKEFREYVNRAPDNPGTRPNKERAWTFIKAFEEK